MVLRKSMCKPSCTMLERIRHQQSHVVHGLVAPGLYGILTMSIAFQGLVRSHDAAETYYEPYWVSLRCTMMPLRGICCIEPSILIQLEDAFLSADEPFAEPS